MYGGIPAELVVQEAINQSALLDTWQAAELLELSEWTIREWAYLGLLHPRYLGLRPHGGRKMWFYRTEIEAAVLRLAPYRELAIASTRPVLRNVLAANPIIFRAHEEEIHTINRMIVRLRDVGRYEEAEEMLTYRSLYLRGIQHERAVGIAREQIARAESRVVA
jgi:hypothetical protein